MNGVAAVRTPRWRALLIPGLFTLVALAVLIGLGSWQLERRAWKQNLLAQIEARAHGAPGAVTPEAQWPAWRAADDEFRRVRVAGTFLPERAVWLHGLMAAQRGAPVQGFYLFTPLRLADGAVVFVNRGFVPTELKDAVGRAERDAPKDATVTGLVRAPETRGWFVPGNDPAREQWFVRDIVGMAQARGLSRVAPFYLDADAGENPNGWPKGGQTNLTLPNNHLQYALTWFGLALTLVGVFGAWVWRQTRSPA